MTRRCYRDALRVVLVYALLLARAQSTPANSTLNESAVSVAQNGSNTVVVYENNTVIVNNNGNNTINVRIVEYTWTEYAGRVWSDYPGRGYVAAGGAFFLFILIVCMLIVAAYGMSWDGEPSVQTARYQEMREIHVRMGPDPEDDPPRTRRSYASRAPPPDEYEEVECRPPPSAPVWRTEYM